MELKIISGIEQIIEILTSCGNDFYNQSYNNEKAIDILSEKFSKFGVVLALYLDNDLAGFISFYANDFDTKKAFLSMIIIRRGFQRKGVGTALLNEMEKYCIENGFNEIISEVDDKNIKSKSFFSKNGYNVTEKKGQGTSFYLKKIR